MHVEEDQQEPALYLPLSINGVNSMQGVRLEINFSAGVGGSY